MIPLVFGREMKALANLPSNLGDHRFRTKMEIRKKIPDSCALLINTASVRHQSSQPLHSQVSSGIRPDVALRPQRGRPKVRHSCRGSPPGRLPTPRYRKRQTGLRVSTLETLPATHCPCHLERLMTAVGDDHVHRIIRQGNIFNFTLQEFDILDSRLTLGFREPARASRDHTSSHIVVCFRLSGPTRLAESAGHRFPLPEPRSSTVSPGCSSARAVGLPHPREARHCLFRNSAHFIQGV